MAIIDIGLVLALRLFSTSLVMGFMLGGLPGEGQEGPAVLAAVD